MQDVFELITGHIPVANFKRRDYTCNVRCVKKTMISAGGQIIFVTKTIQWLTSLSLASRNIKCHSQLTLHVNTTTLNSFPMHCLEIWQITMRNYPIPVGFIRLRSLFKDTQLSVRASRLVNYRLRLLHPRRRVSSKFSCFCEYLTSLTYEFHNSRVFHSSYIVTVSQCLVDVNISS